jgi:acyl-coenzyme A thioesterase PaaI-like protein
VLRPFPAYPACPVCGDPDVNPAALGVRWFWDSGRGLAVGSFTPGPMHAGYKGVLHGGILSALLDECLAWACAVAKGAYCVTGALDLRFMTPARLGDAIDVSARTLASWGRYVRAEAEARTAGGELLARATSTFAALSLEASRELQAALDVRPGDVDVLAPDSPGRDPGAPLPGAPRTL